MTENENSIITERIHQLESNSYIPYGSEELYEKLKQVLNSDNNSIEALEELIKFWNGDLLEAYKGIDKLKNTLTQYESELIIMMDQMDALVKCSLMIKQYSLYLKEEIDKVADKIDKQGLDTRIDHLVELLEEVKPRKYLNLVRDGDVITFPKK